MKKTPETNSLMAWFLASRPKTLAAAAVPVMIGTAMAWHVSGGNGFHVLAAILCFLFAFIMQVDANFVNDYFDFARGNDDETRLGPKRACAEGWVTPSAMKKAMLITTALGCLTGLPLIIYGGVEMIAVGLACVVFCFLYTTTLSYLGLGDILVLVFFGIVPVCCTYYVEVPKPLVSQCPLPELLLLAIACGMVIDTLLIINNYRDIDNDRRAGKKTLAVLIGKKAMSVVYLLIVPTALTIQSVVLDSYYAGVIMGFLTVIHFGTWYKMHKIGSGKALNNVLGITARNIFFYGILTTLSIIYA